MNKSSRKLLGTSVLMLPLIAWHTAALAQGQQSIRKYVSCSGTADDSAGVAKAFAEAKGNAFTLLVDCPVKLHIGYDIARTVFIDNDTTVEFSGAGKFLVDNVMIPAFVFANTNHVTLTNWNVEYVGGIPVAAKIGGYANNGSQVFPGREPGGAVNDQRITPWLAANRGVKFDHSQGNVNSIWANPTNTSAIFFLLGDTSDIKVSGLTVAVPKDAGAEKYVPVVFSTTMGWKSNQAVNGKTPLTPDYVDVPHDLKFTNVTFDGTYMGWVGANNNTLYENIKSHRYSDLQDANGGNVGGVGKWFAPPHLFYLNFQPSWDQRFHNNHLQLRNVVDDGPRVGTARDKGGGDSVSGYALSLKIGCSDCSIDNYQTNRPDGFMDVLPSQNMTVSNVTASFDSSFLNNMFPGWRFPSTGYKNITFQNITITDTAPTTTQLPIGNSNVATNENIVFKNVKVRLHRWVGQGKVATTIGGSNNTVDVQYATDSDR